MKLVQSPVPAPRAARPTPSARRPGARLVPRRRLPTLALAGSPWQRLVRWFALR